MGKDADKMKDYPDRMTPEQARVFGEDVLNIVDMQRHLWEPEMKL